MLAKYMNRRAGRGWIGINNLWSRVWVGDKLESRVNCPCWIQLEAVGVVVVIVMIEKDVDLVNLVELAALVGM